MSNKRLFIGFICGSLITSIASGVFADSESNSSGEKAAEIAKRLPGEPDALLTPLTRMPHDDCLFCVAITPDGSLVATGDQNSTVHLWDATNGTKTATLSGHEGDVVDLQISHDGSRLASLGFDGVRVWRLPSGEAERQIATMRGVTAWVRFAPDGKTLVSGGPAADLPIQFWDVQTGKELQPLSPDSAGSKCAAYSPDGSKLAAAYCKNFTEGEVRIWDVASRRELTRFAAHRNEVRRIEFTADGNGIITADISGELAIWSATSGGPFSTRLPDQKGEITALAVSADGSLFATTSRGDRTVRCWESMTGAEVARFKGHSSVVKSICFSANGKTAVSGGFDSLAFVWSTLPASKDDQAPFAAADGETQWNLLAGEDACAARQAIEQLSRHPDIAFRLAESRIRPLSPSQYRQIVGSIHDLTHKDVEVRRRSANTLLSYGDLAEAALRSERAGRSGLIVRQRLDLLLQAIQNQLLSAVKRTNLRAIQLIERIGNLEAKRILTNLAQGPEHDLCTLAAASALRRLAEVTPESARAARTPKVVDPKNSNVDVSIDSRSETQPSSVTSTHVMSEAEALAAKIDGAIESGWKEAGIVGAPVADDAEWLRRVSLDLTGQIPLAYEVQDFLEDRAADKRSRWIEKLMRSPDYVQRQVRIWRSIFIEPHDSESVFLKSESLTPAMERWLHECISKNLGYDQIVRSLLTMPLPDERKENKEMQDLFEKGASPLGYYFRQNDLSPAVLAGDCSKVFLGVKLECAQCHDHPFADWKRDQFWGFAAFFSGVRSTSRGAISQLLIEGEEPDKASLKVPDEDKVVMARFLDGSEPKQRPDISTRQLLSEWLTSRDNRLFARTAVNRVWAEFFGEGLVEPLDDINSGAASGRQDLVDLLADRFVANNYDLKFLSRTIVSTRAYQRTSRLTDDSQREPHRLAKMPVRSLTGEQIYDGLMRATGRSRHVVPFSEARSYQSFGMLARNDIVRRFSDSAPRTQTEASMVDALFLMNGPFVETLMRSRRDGVLNDVLTDNQSSLSDKIDALYLTALSRHASSDEVQRLIEFVNRRTADASLSEALADAFWILLNSSEFMLNH